MALTLPPVYMRPLLAEPLPVCVDIINGWSINIFIM